MKANIEIFNMFNKLIERLKLFNIYNILNGRLKKFNIFNNLNKFNKSGVQFIEEKLKK